MCKSLHSIAVCTDGQIGLLIATRPRSRSACLYESHALGTVSGKDVTMSQQVRRVAHQQPIQADVG